MESDHLLHQAVVMGDIGVVSRYLADGGSPNVKDRLECEPLYTAVKYDRLEIAEMLLAAGGDIFHRSRFRGNAFGAACWNCNARMIDFCVKAGVDVNEVDGECTILDDLARKKRWVHKDDVARVQATYDKLVGLGAVHGAELRDSGDA